MQDFQSLRMRAKLQGVFARLTGRSNELLSYEDVARKLKLQGRADKGTQSIPVDAIIGSVGRYTDFTRTFLPRRAGDQQRWANVKTVLDGSGAGLDPVEVYKVSEVYFVMDGNHRVSVARQEGWKTIEAHVIEIQTDIPLTRDVQPDELIIKAEYADFLEQTGLSRTQEYVDLKITIPGGYQKLLDEICACCCDPKEESQEDSFPRAAETWYREIYLPFAEAVRERRMMRWFPDRTITDLYVWMTEHRGDLEKELGWDIRPEAAAEVVIQKRNRRAGSAESKVGSWRKARLLNRYSEHLFRDILVPIGSNHSWDALDQAVLMAQRENANIHGLHTMRKESEHSQPEMAALQSRFHEICERGNVRGALAIEIGEPTRKILERAALTDLIVLKIAHPPTTGIQVIGSNIRTLILRSSRPVLAIPGAISKLDHTLLAFDGSPKSQEALFVATYFAEQWKTKLSILSAPTNRVARGSAQDFARNYLEFNEVEAEFITKEYSVETLKLTAEEIGADLIVMGGYGGWILKHITVGSSINFMLRESQFPVLICR